jgi:DNA-binding GntR family transcriptional regulator
LKAAWRHWPRNGPQPDDIEKLERLQASARHCYDIQDWENFLKTDEVMHTYIGTMTRNPVFQFVQKSIHDNIHRYYQDFLPMNQDRTLENLKDFDKIIAAMKAKDGAARHPPSSRTMSSGSMTK